MIRKKKLGKKISFGAIFLALVAVALFVVAPMISGAWFSTTHKSKGDAQMQFGAINVKISQGITLEPKDLIYGNTTSKTITFKNQGTADMYVRFCLSFLAGDGSPLTVTKGDGTTVSLVTYTVDASWQKQSDSQYFYGVITPSQTVTATITIAVSEAMGTDFKASDYVKISLTADGAQVAEQGATYDSIAW